MNEEWTEKLAHELNKEREKSKQDILKLETRLQENFKMVRFILNKKEMKRI